MSIPLIVVGAGGFGRECLDVVEAMNAASVEPVYDLLGVVDANPSEVNLRRLASRGVAWLGAEEAWLDGGFRADYLIGIGNPQVRRTVDDVLRSAGLRAAIAVHPLAVLGSDVEIGEGSVVCGGVQVSTNVKLGRHVHLNPNATIGHDTVIQDFVSVNPSATISGDVEVKSGTLVGAGAVILQGLLIDGNVVVGAGACVVRDVSRNQVVKGVPAR